jgi:hypothetical protein
MRCRCRNKVDSEDWFIEHFQRAVYETPKIECSLDTNCYSASRPIPVPFASALLMDLPLFWMDLTLFWPHASRVGYGHRWPFSLRILNKAVSRLNQFGAKHAQRHSVARIAAPCIAGSWRRST